jgi:hypothetical protein
VSGCGVGDELKSLGMDEALVLVDHHLQQLPSNADHASRRDE